MNPGVEDGVVDFIGAPDPNMNLAGGTGIPALGAAGTTGVEGVGLGSEGVGTGTGAGVGGLTVNFDR